MNYGKPELPIHERVRQSRAALCGMTAKLPEPEDWVKRAIADQNAYLGSAKPLITDESTARCGMVLPTDESPRLFWDTVRKRAERDPAFAQALADENITQGESTRPADPAIDGEAQMAAPERKVEYLMGRCAGLEAERDEARAHICLADDVVRQALTERDDLARRCADLENTISRMQAEYESRGVGVRLPAAGVPQSDYDRLLESYHVANRLAREMKAALDKANNEIESLKAREVRHPVAPGLPPHGNPAALGDYANEVLTDFSLPEPAQLNEAIPASAASQTSAPDGSAPAPGPIPAQALRYSR